MRTRIRIRNFVAIILGTDMHVYTFRQFLFYNSNCKLITTWCSEKRILLKDVPTAPDMTSVSAPFKMCGWFFYWTIVTQEFAIWAVTIVKIRSYSTKTASVTDKSGCWSVTIHTAEESRETLTVWQRKDSGECIASLSDVRAPDWLLRPKALYIKMGRFLYDGHVLGVCRPVLATVATWKGQNLVRRSPTRDLFTV